MLNARRHYPHSYRQNTETPPRIAALEGWLAISAVYLTGFMACDQLPSASRQFSHLSTDKLLDRCALDHDRRVGLPRNHIVR